MNEAECVGGVGVGGGGVDGDCNSNHHATLASTSTASCLSNASSQDIGDFVQDNSDYQWFLDYGYRDGVIHHHHTSVLSSLTESYGGPEEIDYYDALSKNLDANLAEADMESFRTEDIHALLTTLPAMCTDMQLITDANREGEMFASVSGSMMAKFDLDSSVSPHSSTQGDDVDVSAASPDTMSICKSELLFSPVKETPMPGANFSVDSLDCDLEHDIMLTCQANKDNYTIAFEGSVTMYSEESDDLNTTDKSETANSDSHRWMYTSSKSHHQKLIDTSMARSDSGLTTWSKLKKRSSENQLRRHPSGNNNHTVTSNNNNSTDGDEVISFSHFVNDNALKSQSMPNLHRQKGKVQLTSGDSTMLESPLSVLRRPHCVKVFDIQHQMSRSSAASCYSDMALSLDGGVTSQERQLTNKSNTQLQQQQQQNQHGHNFSLVRQFLKQKSLSADGMACSMDQSVCSQSDISVASEDLKNNRTNCNNRMTKSGSVFLDSLADPQSNTNRKHDLIREEMEDPVSERSESVEQLSESISMINSYENVCCPKQKFNVNNNNSSVEQDDECVARRRIRRGIQTKRCSTTSNESGAISDASSSTESAEYSRKPPTTIVVSTKHNATQFPVRLMNRSMQTSRFGDGHVKLTRSGYGNDFIRVIEPSFLTKLKQQGDCQKPVYIVYPSYTLPDLDFLKDKREDITKVFLVPQKFDSDDQKLKKVSNTTTIQSGRGRRPFSCNDMELLKKKGFGHIRDWDSLTFLLPVECRQVLSDVPEFMNVIKEKEEEILKMKEKPLFCVSPPMRHKPRPVSCDCGSLLDRNNMTNVSSSSSTATQPSSGYRGSSTMLLTDSSQNSPAPTSNNFNPLFVYRYDSVTSSEASLMTSATPPVPKRTISLSSEQKKCDSIPPRPPLPKGILRKSLENAKTKKNLANTKRYSMFEMGETDEYSEEDTCNYSSKRKSVHEPYYLPHRRTFSEHSTETEDEGVEAGHGTDSSVDERFENVKIRPPTPPLPKTGDNFLNFGGAISCDELDQLEDYLKMSGISYSESDEWDENELLKLRSHVNKFLSLKINKDRLYDLNYPGKKSVSFAEKVIALDDVLKQYSTPPNSPNVSAVIHRHYQGKTLVDMPICEEGELSPDGYHSPQMENISLSEKSSPADISQKMALVSAVTQSVEQLIQHFSAANDQGELNALGDAELNPACAKLVLSSLCPALYALLSDNLKPTLETSFGAISNSVWQVVEASAQQGPLTKALNELVMRINGEDVISEGLLKFNAFVFGLLNVRSLDAWASYLRTRETILRKHYNADSILLQAQTGGASMRSLLDTLVATLQPLALLPFHMDLLFEYRQLHISLRRMDSYHQPTSPTHKILSVPHLTQKQLTLIKLVRSVQSTMSQSCDDTSDDISTATAIQRSHRSPPPPPPADPAPVSSPTLPDLLNSSAQQRTQLRDETKRPRSCVDGFKLGEDIVAGALLKRWSGINLGTKFVQAFERLADDTEEEYTDSLEHAANARLRTIDLCTDGGNDGNSNGDGSSSPGVSLHDDGPESIESHACDEKPISGGKFRRLQMKWEMLSGRDIQPSPPTSPNHSTTPTSSSNTTTPSGGKSKIPRLVNSPVKSGIPVLTTITPKTATVSSKPPLKKLATTPPGNGTTNLKRGPVKAMGVNKKPSGVTRTSRVDQLESPEHRVHPVRPSSLPYRPVSSTKGGKGSKLIPPRRAVSSSVNRKPNQVTRTPKVVRTLTHRLPSDNGHLSFNEGDKLKVILEVDSKWFLCCRGDQKGLVPRSAVIALSDTGGGACTRN